jgi:hypothetical protein
VHGLRVRRLRARLDLDAKLALRGVRVEVARRGNTAAGADVREEPERVDVREGVGEGEDVAADRRRRWGSLLLLALLLMLVGKLVDVEDDLVRSLGRDRRDDEMVIVEERKNGLVMATYSNRLWRVQIKGHVFTDKI